MTLQEQNQLKPGSIFYFLEPGPMQWRVENGVMKRSTAFFIRTAFFVRMNYIFNPSLGKRVKCACCFASTHYGHYLEAEATLLEDEKRYWEARNGKEEES